MLLCPKRILFVCLLAFSPCFGTAVNAASITGEIGFHGPMVPEDEFGNDLTSFTGATFLNFLDDLFTLYTPSGTNGEISANTASGDFLTLFTSGTVTNPGEIRDLDLSLSGELTGFVSWVNGSNYLVIDLISFNVTQQEAEFLDLAGTVRIRASGFEDTTGNFTFSGRTAGSLFNFVAGSSPTRVPEPSTLALLGTGLLAAGLLARRRKEVGQRHC